MKAHFDIHGCSVAVEARDRWLGALAVQGMERLASAPPERPAQITVVLDGGARVPPDPRLPIQAALRIDKGFVQTAATVRTDGDRRTVVDLGEWATAMIDHDEGRIEVRIHDLPFVARHYDPLYSSSVLLKSLLLELLPAFGIVPLHAGMCSLGGAGVIVCGPPRSGKTRVVCALVAGGAAFMADELGFVLVGAALGPALGGFPIRARVHPRHAEEMAAAGFQPIARGRDGAIVADPPDRARTCDRTAPSVLLIIDPEAAGSSPVEPLEAAARLLTYRTSFSRRHEAAELDAMCALADKVRAVRIGPALALGSPGALLDEVRSFAA